MINQDWAQTRAEKCAAIMMEKDAASQALGMKIDRIGPGRATLSFDVLPHMLNGHEICHGGYIFTLADSAFAFACNTYNQLTVAQQNQITYLMPGQLGDRLSAEAVETARTGRSGTYDVRVTNDKGDLVALFRGLSRTINGHHYAEDGDKA
ncbi:hydroxyphenylacetyl-CoA thioesterase PaaI [Roseobacter sp. EG26]|uniref:hydroxyphenylacetyl-CoA thioesterase PaaI n=1 Tax=Roseobacter sp. EG26 TaxID=3412477 RepID=UPI003CE56981